MFMVPPEVAHTYYVRISFRPVDRVTIHTDARRRFIKLDKLVLEFKRLALSRLYWPGQVILVPLAPLST